MEEFRLMAGIDWATEAHEVAVLRPDGSEVETRSYPHSGAGLADLTRRLADLAGGDPAAVAVAIEVPHGSVVETMLERGFAVFAINPKQLDRFRDRFTVAGAKDDRFDARVLADSLRTDRPCFRRLQVEAATFVELREWTRVHDDLQRDRVALVNRLREQQRRYFPAFLDLTSDPGEEWALALWFVVPTPDAAKKATRARVAKILADHRIRRVDADSVLEALRQPPVYVTDGTQQAAVAHIGLLVPRIRLVNQQLKECRRYLERILECLAAPGDAGQSSEQRDVAIILSMPGIGVIGAATLLAEAASLLRARDYRGLRAHGGAAPVTRRSGKKTVVSMRTACSPQLRNVLYHWARVAVMHDPLSKRRYQSLRERGKSNGQALRTVVDRLLAVLCAMLRTQTEFRPTATAAA